MALTKTDLVSALREQESEHSRTQAVHVVETIINLIKESLARGEGVLISRFGGIWIQENFKLWGENEPLMEDCRVIAQRETLYADGAALVIIASLWERLRESHRLRVVG